MGYLVKTRPPFSILLLILIVIITISETIFNQVWIVYSIPFYLIFYVLFCRYCCAVSITRFDLNIHYFALWKKDIDIKTEDITRIDYEKGYYDWFADKPINRYYHSLQYCYDRLIVYKKDQKNPILYLNVNTRAFDFTKILKWAIDEKLLDKI